MSDFDLSPREPGSGKPASADSSANTSPASEPDYRKKYAGQVKKYDEARRQVERLQEALDAQIANHEEELSNVRRSYKDADKKLKELQDQLAAIQAEKETLARTVHKATAEKAARALINEKFPGLKDMWDEGVLKDATEFETPEAFEGYLAKAAKLAGVQTSTPDQPNVPPEDPARRVAGITPSVNVRTTATGKVQRSSADIAEAMFNLNERDPNFSQNFQALEAEMREAMEAGL